MPRADRLVELVHLLGGRRSRSLVEIVRHFEVSERTVYRDLADLSHRNIPITHDDLGYRLVEGARIRPLNLSAAERAVLRLALDNPSLRASELLGRRLATLEAKLDAVTDAAGEEPPALVLATLDRSGPSASKVLDGLERAIHSRTAVSLHYRSLTRGKRRWRGINPYQVFHRSDAWYLVGHCHVHDEPRTFRLDRIAAIRVLTTVFEIPAGFSVEEYLAESWALYRGRRSHEVVLHFEPALASLIEAARHHRSERLERMDSGALEYRARVSHLDEIARWVVGFGGRCRVVEPEALRQRVMNLAKGVTDANATNEVRATDGN
jgi:predicted DNA-binding transcriptional regulator YafY